jgi:hypothetical protein
VYLNCTAPASSEPIVQTFIYIYVIRNTSTYGHIVYIIVLVLMENRFMYCYCTYMHCDLCSVQIMCTSKYFTWYIYVLNTHESHVTYIKSVKYVHHGTFLHGRSSTVAVKSTYNCPTLQKRFFASRLHTRFYEEVRSHFKWHLHIMYIIDNMSNRVWMILSGLYSYITYNDVPQILQVPVHIT